MRPISMPLSAALCAGVSLLIGAAAAFMLRRPVPLWLFFLGVLALTCLLCAGARRFSGKGFTVKPCADRRAPRRAFALGAALCLLSMAVYMLGYYPGGYSSDTFMQWDQTVTRTFGDHHPALHTLLIFALRHICDAPAFVLGVQLVCFALAVGYMAAALARWSVPRVGILLAVGYVCLSPGIANLMPFLWKDCAFAIVALVLGVQLFEIVCSHGAWLQGRPHRLALGLTLCLCAIFRHNGIALSLSAGVWLLLVLRGQRRRVCAALACFVLLFAGIKGPLYRAAGVARDAGSVTELFGVPMVVLSHVYAEAPQSLDEQTVRYLETIAPWQVYHDYDDVGDWNSIKWHVGTSDLSAYSMADICAFALRAAKAEPELAFEALSYLWQLPLFPFGYSYWRFSPYVDPAMALEETGLAPVRRVLNALSRLCAQAPFSWLFWNPGFPLLSTLLLCALVARRRPAVALTLPAAVAAYVLATSAVLSSPTDYRFFLIVPMLWPLCALGLLVRTSESP